MDSSRCLWIPVDSGGFLQEWEGHSKVLSRDEAMEWVDPFFDKVARGAYLSIGSPSLSNMSTGWSIFSAMAAVITL